MAIAYRTSATGGNTTSGTSPTAAITPALNDLFLVFCQIVGGGGSPTCSDNNSSGAYTLLFNEGSNSSANHLACFVRTTLLGSTASTTVTVATGAHTATEMCVVAISGCSSAGSAAIYQSGVQANQSASTTPAPVLSSAILPGDIILSAVGNATNPAGVTVPAGQSPILVWTRNQNIGQTGCGLGVSSSAAVFGTPSSSTITWGSASASVFASCAVEITNTPNNTGVNVSKLVSYGVITPPLGVDVSKLLAYGVLAPPIGVSVSKLVAYGVLINANTNPPVWPVVSPPNGYVGNPYSYSWDLAPAAPPTTYTITSGSLPPGLSLTSPGGASGDVGEISGTPTTIGTYSFTVLATNAYGTAPQAMSITISAPVGGNYGYVG